MIELFGKRDLPQFELIWQQVVAVLPSEVFRLFVHQIVAQLYYPGNKRDTTV